MQLKDLLQFDNIVVQCHDNPDADAIASGYAVYKYLLRHEKKVRLVYSGRYKLQKSNLVLMVMKLDIPIEYVEKIHDADLLVTVDCQYGQSNVTKLNAENIATIDHHQISGELPELSEVRSNLGACSTLVRDMYLDAGIDINVDSNLSTALYYGLLTDTNNFAEINHPMDKDLRDEAKYDKGLINLFRNSNLSLTELGIAGAALMGYKYVDDNRFALVEAQPCDPNVLGMISDLTLEVDSVDSCLVYSILPFGIKFSVRSCVKEVNAGELAEFIADGIGGGGGHYGKAGGFIQGDLLGDCDNVGDFLKNRMASYFEDVEIIYAAEYEADVNTASECIKKNLPVGYVKGTDIVPSGTNILVRTLEGDLEVDVTEDIYIMIGIKGEVYPCKKDKFDRSYVEIPDKYVFDGEYEPTVKDNTYGHSLSIVPFAKSCVPTGEVSIFAKELDHRVKVFTAWDKDKYMQGKVGDFLAFRKDDFHDVYVIEHNIFYKTYESKGE